MSVLETMLEMCKTTRDVPHIVGEAGIGKSEMVASFAKKKGMKCTTLFLSQMEPSDLIGMPVVDDFGNTIWAKPVWLTEIEENDKKGIATILFLDEISRAATDTLNSIMEVCLNKTLHTHKLPESTFIVTATNPANGKYRTQKLDPALMNRFLFIKMEANPITWLEWARDNGVHRAVMSFISKNEDKLNFSDDRSEQSATPRSWTKLSENLFALEKLAPSNECYRTLFVGKLGLAIGGQFYNFYREFSKNIEPNDIIDFCKNADIDINNYQASIMTVAEKMKTDLLDGVEHIQLIDVAHKLAKRYLDVGITGDRLTNNEAKKQVFPLATILWALPREVAASAFKQTESNDKMKDLFCMCDEDKTLIRSLIMTKFDKDKK
mgnify:FL=1